MLTDIKGIGFDLDGTLVNSLPGLAAAIDAMLQSEQLSVAGQQHVATWIGNGANVLVERALNWAGVKPSPSELASFRAVFDRYYLDTIQQGSQLYPGVLTTLSTLRQCGMKLALVTNKPSPFVQPLLKQLDIETYFDVVVGGDDVIEKKPHPAPIYLILAKLGLLAQQLVFVGDSCNDIQAAKAAYCPTIGLTYGYNYGQPIASSQPDFILDKFDDILSLISTSRPNE